MKVIHYILSNTPIGEHKVVLADLQTLLGSEIIQSEEVSHILLEAISSHGALFIQDSKKWVISRYSKIAQALYFDPKFEMQFEVNPFELSLSNFSSYPYGNQRSKALQGRLDEYLESHFPDTAAGRVYVEGEICRIFIGASVNNVKNLWTGEFISEWAADKSEVSGKCMIKAHCFEEGSYQYSKNDEVRVGLKETEEALWVDEIFKVIRESDSKFQQSFVSLSSEIPHKLFKPMRRTMAVTRTKFTDMHKSKMLS